MMHSWVPHDCYYPQLSEEYILANDFRFFSDPAATIEVPLEIVRLGEFEELYSGLDHHVLHCAYICILLMISTNENRRGRETDSLSVIVVWSIRGSGALYDDFVEGVIVVVDGKVGWE